MVPNTNQDHQGKDLVAVSNLDGLFSLFVEFQEQLLEEFEKEHLKRQQTSKSMTNSIMTSTTCLSIVSWANVLEKVLDLQLDWIALQPLLCSLDKDGNINYIDFLARYNTQGNIHTSSGNISTKEEDHQQHLKKRNAFNQLYRHRARLEALFHILDHDGNGKITLEELDKSIQILNEHLPKGTKPFTNAKELMRLLDFTHDNQININEFMECFRLNAKMTVHAKWKRTRQKIKILSALGMLKKAIKEAEQILSPHGSVKVLGFDEEKIKQLEEQDKVLSNVSEFEKEEEEEEEEEEKEEERGEILSTTTKPASSSLEIIEPSDVQLSTEQVKVELE
jgi:hypothetical protein